MDVLLCATCCMNSCMASIGGYFRLTLQINKLKSNGPVTSPKSHSQEFSLPWPATMRLSPEPCRPEGKRRGWGERGRNVPEDATPLCHFNKAAPRAIGRLSLNLNWAQLPNLPLPACSLCGISCVRRLGFIFFKLIFTKIIFSMPLISVLGRLKQKDLFEFVLGLLLL